MSVNITVRTSPKNDGYLNAALSILVFEFIGPEMVFNCYVYTPTLTFDVKAPDKSWVTKLKRKFPGASVEITPEY